MLPLSKWCETIRLLLVSGFMNPGRFGGSGVRPGSRSWGVQPCAVSPSGILSSEEEEVVGACGDGVAGEEEVVGAVVSSGL